MKKTKIIAPILAALLALTGCSATPNTESKTVMTVGDVSVPAGIYEFYLNSYMGAFATEEAGKIALEQCKNNFLTVALAHSMNVELDAQSQDSMDSYKQRVIDSYKDQDGGYKGFLKENKLTDADVDMLISVSYYTEALRSKLEPVEYTDADKQQFFNDNYRRAKHILITVDEDMNDEEKEAAKTKAEELLGRAQGGEDFDALVAEYSEDPGSQTNPDGYFFTDNEMVQEFQDGVDSIQPGEFTLVQTTYGYHVIQRLPLDDNAELYQSEYDKVAETITDKMESKRLEEQAHAWAEEYGIETNVDEAAVDECVKEVDAEYQKTRESLANNQN